MPCSSRFVAEIAADCVTVPDDTSTSVPSVPEPMGAVDSESQLAVPSERRSWTGRSPGLSRGGVAGKRTCQFRSKARRRCVRRGLAQISGIQVEARRRLSRSYARSSHRRRTYRRRRRCRRRCPRRAEINLCRRRKLSVCAVETTAPLMRMLTVTLPTVAATVRVVNGTRDKSGLREQKADNFRRPEAQVPCAKASRQCALQLGRSSGPCRRRGPKPVDDATPAV